MNVIARHKSESTISREMDLKRAETLWMQGGKLGGKLFLPLMQLEELPVCYQIGEPFDAKDVEEAFEGRRQHHRNIRHDHGLDDDTWVMVRVTIHKWFTIPLTLCSYHQALEESEAFRNSQI
jgi:hypothetical protein